MDFHEAYKEMKKGTQEFRLLDGHDTEKFRIIWREESWNGDKSSEYIFQVKSYSSTPWRDESASARHFNGEWVVIDV